MCPYCTHLAEEAANAAMAATIARERLDRFPTGAGFWELLQEYESADAAARQLRRELAEHQQRH